MNFNKETLVTYPSEKIESSMEPMGDTSHFRWRIPSYRIDNSELKDNKRSNRYLMIRGSLISNMIKRGEYKKALDSYIGVLRTSKSFWVYAYNKGNRTGYVNEGMSATSNTFRQFVKCCRTLPAKVDMKRVYIKKKNGKLRPLGIPKLEHRILNSAGAEFIYATQADKIMDSQHGFRKGRGIGTAWKEIIKKTQEGKKIGEFDLKSFFNTINPLSINQILSKVDIRLAGGVKRVNLNTFPKFKNNEMYYEEEYKRYIQEGINVLEKKGVPQGLPGSPLLASLVLSNTGFKEEDLIMYADDGLVFYDPTENFNDVIRRLENSKGFKQSGIQFAEDKCGEVTEKLKFCGCELNLDTRILTIDGKKYNADALNDDHLKKIIGKIFYDGSQLSNRGKGNIHKDSGLLHNSKIGGNLILFLKLLLEELKQGMGMKPRSSSFRREGLHVYNYIEASTYATNYLLKLKVRSDNRHRKKYTVPVKNYGAWVKEEVHTYKNPKRLWKREDGSGLYYVNAPSYYYKGFMVN